MENLVGRMLNRYQISSLLGEGGMGAVYRAHDGTLQRDVAIKVMHDNFASQPEFRDRFLQEARTAARLDHPGIVQVYDFGQDRGLLYIVMKFIPGDNLEKMLRDLQAQNRWIPLQEGVNMIRLIAIALEYAHKQNVLHRDLKPGNIMIEPEPSDGLPYRPVITDLGLAKLAHGAMVTQDSSSMGTPAYMSPEQAMGRQSDPRSDVYSLGILLFELATGRLPFIARNLSEAIKYHVQTPPPNPSSIRPEIPEALDQVILKSIQKDPDRRYQTAIAMAEALKEVLPSVALVTSAPSGAQANISLLTQYQNSLIEVRGASILGAYNNVAPPTPNPDFSQDRLQIIFADQTSRAINIQHPSMTIGRDPDNELSLDDPKASRRHARIDFDGRVYQITDLNSTNGTYLGNNRLTPGVSQTWNSELVLRVGDTFLRLLRAGQPFIPGLGPTVVAETRVAAAQTKPSVPSGEAPATRQVQIAHAFISELQPARIKSGQVGRVTIRNLGEAPDSYTLSWRVPSQALDFTPPTMQVNLVPGQEVVVEFRSDARESNWFGSEKTYGFNAQINPSIGKPQVHSGEVFNPPSIPTWTLPVLLLLCLILVGATFLLFSLVFGGGIASGGKATETASISQTQLAAVQLTNTAGTATALALEGANQATLAAATATGMAQATSGAATQTAILVNAQTSVAQTAAAQQGTFEAGVVLTSQAQQATLQAGAAQTSAAQTALAQSSSLQTAAALTAIAAQQTNQALSATLTAQAQRRAAYIYSSDSNTANDYRSYLQSQGYVVDLVPMGSIFATNFASYKLILIGPETGNVADYQNAPWGDASETQAQFVSAAGKPVVGLGRGGSLYFQALGLYINWGQSWTGTANDIYVVDPAAAYWNFPNSVSIPADQIIKLYDSNSPFLAVYLPGPIAQVSTIGRQSDNNDHFPIIMESSRFFLWGFDAGPSAMSTKGQRVLLNILWNLAP
jgi:serine/threonine protein kinase